MIKELSSGLASIALILIVWGIGVGVHSIIGDNPFAVLVAFIVWYSYYSFETALNGGMGNGWTMAFRYLKDDILCNIPIIGYNHRLKLTNGDEEWANELPGIFHLLFTHVAIPVGTFIAVSKLVGN